MLSKLKVNIGNCIVAGMELQGGDIRVRSNRMGNVFLGFRSTIAIIAFEALFPEGRYVEDEDGTPYFMIPGLKLDDREMKITKTADRTTLKAK